MNEGLSESGDDGARPAAGRGRAWVDVNLGAVRRNLSAVRAVLTPGTQVLAVLKADAYGLGAVPVAKALADGVDAIGVAEVCEAAALRTAGVAVPILVLGPSFDDELEDVVRHGVMPTITSLAELRALQAVARQQLGPAGRHPLHVCIETGMNRYGVSSETLPALLDALRDECSNLRLDGLYTHLSTPAEPTRGFTHQQMRELYDALAAARRRGLSPACVHAASSAAALNYEAARGTMVRLGLSLHGIEPGWWAERRVALEPVAALRARVLSVWSARAGEPVSYERSQYLTHDTRLASLAIGYADGVRRTLSGRGHVLLHGQPCPIVGRVTMDTTIVDVGHVPGVAPGDVATLFGRDGQRSIALSDVAAQADTIPYEVLCGLGRRVARRYV